MPVAKRSEVVKKVAYHLKVIRLTLSTVNFAYFSKKVDFNLLPVITFSEALNDIKSTKFFDNFFNSDIWD